MNTGEATPALFSDAHIPASVVRVRRGDHDMHPGHGVDADGMTAVWR